ncbi:hypothetical protein AB73_4755 [Escherichia coli 3-020-07_S1_C3]|nr:hypothetical protein AC58_4939 [Escherichia coli 3-105-05_S3_C3]KDZ19202.1 hypothetical protein AB15_4651 [Escherichia coli 3-020-07_S1_C1]KDZ20192.1 hypothetical protein AB43_4883 [Escherichia coli 3-020-07_S1_C2]KDZ29727.1 hypothetical protein AB73_4755 [Escherichia coli 3-020-07_S1_C3]UFD96061.1 hypothetical protein [Escherichia coli]
MNAVKKQSEPLSRMSDHSPYKNQIYNRNQAENIQPLTWW